MKKTVTPIIDLRYFGWTVLIGTAMIMGSMGYLKSSFSPPPPAPETPLALKDIIKAAESGDSESQYTAYKIFGRLTGEETKKQSIKFLTMAAGNGHPKALYYLARTYEERSDHANAFRFYKDSADKNFPPAYLALSDLYQFGHGTQQDGEKSLEYLERAAKSGINVAQYNYANALRDKATTEEDLMEASFYYRMAANNQIKFAAIFLNEQAERCLSSPHLTDETIPACLLASYSGNGEIEEIISLFYRYGLVLPPSPQASNFWTERSSYHGNFHAQLDLIRNTLTGFGREQDIGHAYQLYREIKDCPIPHCLTDKEKTKLDQLYNLYIKKRITLWDRIKVIFNGF